ncbi:MAG: CCC motif membrane protein [Chitinophagaceae bacterium]
MEHQNQFRENQYVNNPQVPLPNSTAVLVLGIVSIMGCFCYGFPGLICSIIALVLGGKDKRIYEQNPTAFTPGSYNNLKAGRVCAVIGLILSAIYAVTVIVLIVLFGATVLSNPQDVLKNLPR